MTLARMMRSAAVLQVRDVVKSEAFYRQKLGFRGGSIWGEPPCFCIVGRGTVTIFLDQTRDVDAPLPLNQYWAAYVYVDDVDALFEEYKAKGVDVMKEPLDTFYGCREIDVRDPDGHIIGFGQDLEPSGAGPGL